METIISNFKNPPGKYRPAPLWVWNDRMTPDQIDFQLTQLAGHGFGGAFVHPRPGLVTEYLSDEWFALWGHALEKAKELGMQLSIYDENSYPSGFAGGHVSAACPEALSTLMACSIVRDPAQIPQKTIAVFAAQEKEGMPVHARNLCHMPRDQWPECGNLFIVITSRTDSPTGWMAGFSYVDLLRPQVHDAFLKSTHERYYKHFGKDFGTDIPALFTDEPCVGQGAHGELPFSFWFAHEFKKRNGYDLTDSLPCIFMDVEGDCFPRPPEKVRFDYFDTIHELWVKNSIEPTGSWCEEHNISWTGHYLEHQWPQVSCRTSPAIQSYYEYHQWPAIDMLLSDYLRDRPTHSITHTIRELKSASNQFSKARALCELYGAGGWDSCFDDYKRMADWVMVNGVNFICQHLVFSTIMGARKHDHPQSFDWRQPWWEEYTVMNDYIGRVSWMLTRGRMEQRILVLNPSTTAYLTEPGKAAGSAENADLDSITSPDMTEFLRLCQKLSDLQWDFDLGDEYTLARHGKAQNGSLQVAGQNYACVIITGSMKNMLSSTAQLLESCIQNGVSVIASGSPGCYVDGMRDPQTYAALAGRWQEAAPDDMDLVLSGILPRRITASRPFPEGFAHMRRKLENGDEIWFFTNQAMETYEADVQLCGSSLRQAHLFTGEISEIPCSAAEGRLTVPIRLVRNQSLMLIVSHAAQSGQSAPQDGAASPDGITPWAGTIPLDRVIPLDKAAGIPLKPAGIFQERENIFPLSYADYGETKDTYVKELCDKIFRERGFPGNPWDNKVQFRQNIVERDGDYDERSGFTALYHFTVEDGFLPETISAAAEHPEYCRLRVNGTPVPWKPGETFLDHHTGVADISECVRPGANTLEIIVDVFHVLMELDTVYIRGNFAVTQQNDRWILSRARPLEYGSWKEQGLPFYSYAVQYAYTAFLNTVPKAALLDLKDYDASVVSLRVNGKDGGLLHADGRRARDIASLLQQGENTIVLRVCGSYKNLLGPHFSKARGSAWPAMWRANPLHTPKAGTYDIMDFGIHDAPVLTAVR